MDTHDQLVKKLMRRPGVRAEVERIEREESRSEEHTSELQSQ